MKTLARTLVGFSLCAGLSILTACGGEESTATTVPSSEQPANPLASTDAPPAKPSPDRAHSFGTPSGMGLSTGDAAHSGGMGTGLMGFNGIGAAGTSGAISDTSPVNRVVPEKTEEKP